jgi:Protein of unknown function (DUF1573)
MKKIGADNTKRLKTIRAVFFLAIGISYGIQAQPIIEFEKSTHDFGRVEEAQGPVVYQFSFTNNGDAPLVIAGVKASCGCTTPFWTKEPIPPGEKGSVQAKFDPKNRPGGFSKSLTVTSNSEPNISMLFIKGYVEPSPKTPEEEYTKVMGGLRLKSNYLNMGKMYESDTLVSKDFKFYNASDTLISFGDMKAVPKFIDIQVIPTVVKPNELGIIRVNYYPSKRGDLGLMNDMVTLLTDEHGTKSMKYLNITGHIKQYFPPMTEEEKARAPRIVYSTESHDFGNINQGEKKSYKFVFTNQGKQDLDLRKLKSTCGCTASFSEKKIVGPGEESFIEVTFNSKGRNGKQYKNVTVFSNDPQRPESRLEIRANVIKAE